MIERSEKRAAGSGSGITSAPRSESVFNVIVKTLPVLHRGKREMNYRKAPEHTHKEKKRQQRAAFRGFEFADKQNKPDEKQNDKQRERKISHCSEKKRLQYSADGIKNIISRNKREK